MPETENQTPPTKARQTGRAFFIPKTEYETQQPAFALFLAGTSHFGSVKEFSQNGLQALA